MLVGLGLKVWTIDVRDYEYKGVSTDLNSIKGDVRKTDFESNFFDVVTAVSTIEHVGLGRYGDQKDNDGDKESVQEIRRILKPNGTLFLTVPFGKRCITSSYRVYDKEGLETLLSGFKIIKADFFLANDKTWIKATEDQVTNKDCTAKEKATACIQAAKLPF